jgi:hypothetical protein
MIMLAAAASLAACDRVTEVSPAPSKPSTAPARALGSLSRDDVVVPVAEAHALWDAKERRLTILLVPTALSPEERARVEKGEAFFALSNKPSPDPAKWKRYPHAEFSLTFKEGAPTTRENVMLLHLFAYSFKQEGMCDNYNASGTGAGERIQSLDLKLDASGGSVSIASDGDESYLDGRIGWNLNVTVPVRVVVAK